MTTQYLGRLAIGAAASGAAAAAVVVLAAANGPSLEAKLGVLGVELSLSIGDAPAAGSPALLEASVLRRSADNRMTGFDVRVAKSGGLRIPAAVPGEAPVSQAAAAAPANAPCTTSDT